MLLAQMDWAGVERAVLLQGPFYGEADATVASAVKRWPDRFLGAFAPDPRASDVRQQFDQCVDEYGFRVVKFELTETTGLDRSLSRSGYRFAGIPLDLRRGAAAEYWLSPSI